MRIDLIGCSAAGKTTLAKAIVRTCRERGIEAWQSEDFVARKVGLGWMGQSFLRRRLLESVAFLFGPIVWYRHRDFHAFVWRIIRGAPGSWFYKLGLIRHTVRKTWMHDLVHRHIGDGQLVISDNEAVLQGAHHLFVHPDGMISSALITAFGSIAPRSDVVVHLRAPEEVLVERTLRRGHRRLGNRPLEVVQRFIHGAITTFEKLQADPARGAKMLKVCAPGSVHFAEVVARDGETLSAAARLVSAGLEAAVPAEERCVGPTAVSPADLTSILFERLNDEVVYCHVPEAFSLVASSSPQRELDVLVNTEHLPRTRVILSEVGFKLSVGQPRRGKSERWDYLGHDRAKGHLVAVRVFTTLSIEKSGRRHRLPLEAMLFERSELVGSVRVPSEDAALVLHVMRTFTSGRTVLGTWLDEGDQHDFRWLESRSSVVGALALLREYCPFMSETLFVRCLNVLHNGESGPARIALGWQIRRRLRNSRTEGASTSSGSVASGTETPGRLAVNGKKPWPTSGCVIAFVGPDATGKSTLVRETARWLGGRVPVESAHLGKPPSSWTTAPINQAFRVARRIASSGVRQKVSARESRVSEKVGLMSLVYAVRAVSLALDRRRAVTRVRRVADGGTTVICDRYPCDTLHAMDGPRLDAGAPFRGLKGRTYRMLARAEDRLYRDLPPPDILIKLTVSLETAKQRNRDRQKKHKHQDKEIEERHAQVGGSADLLSLYTSEINTDATLDETLLAVKRAIWEGL